MDSDQRSSTKEKINWENSQSLVLLNDHWPVSETAALQYLSERFHLDSHLWIASSGSSAKDLRSVKLIALGKKAFLKAAEAANHHLQSNSKDIWLNSLPLFHVGGLSIYARVHLSGAQVFDFIGGWNARNFSNQIEEKKITLTSLVPTQVFDLVDQEIRAPSSLRAIVVGGGALAADLYQKALALGWPVLPSFGMTECCSQVATAEIESLKTMNPRLKILSHIKADLDQNGFLKLKSESLLTGYAQWKEDEAVWIDPKQDAWFTSEDKVKLENGFLIPEGRGQHYIKILGEGVSLFRLQEIFDKIVREEDPSNWQSYALVAVPDVRMGNKIVMAHATTDPSRTLLITNKYNSQVLRIEKIQQNISVSKIPRSDLGKIKYEQLNQDLKNFF